MAVELRRSVTARELPAAWQEEGRFAPPQVVMQGTE